MSAVIEKYVKHVDILVNDSNKIVKKHLIYLNEVSKYGCGKETLKEFLESNSNSFIPARLFNTDHNTIFVAINLANICFVKDYSVMDSVVEIQKEITVIFTNGVKQKIAINAAEAKNYGRVIDYFNTPGRFKEFVCFKSLIYINKEQVVRITEEE